MKTIYSYYLIVSLIIGLSSCTDPVVPINMEAIAGLNTILDYTSSSDGVIAYSVSGNQKITDKEYKTFAYIKGINYYTKAEFDITSKNVNNMDSNIAFTTINNVQYIFFLRNGEINYSKFTQGLATPKPLNTNIKLKSFKIQGNVLAFTTFVYPEFGDDISKTVNKDAEVSNRKYQIYEKLIFRFWNSWSQNKVEQLFTATLKVDGENILFDKSPVNRFNNNNHNINQGVIYLPQFAMADFYDIRPDGKEVVFTVVEDNLADLSDANDEHAKRFNTWQTYIVDITDNTSNTKRELISNFLNTTTSYPKYSPNGQMIMFLTGQTPDSINDVMYFKLYENKSLRSVKILDRQIINFNWFDDYSIYFAVHDNGHSKLGFLRLDFPDQDPVITSTKADDNLSNHGINIRITNTLDIVCLRSSYKKTPELYSFSFDFYNNGSEVVYTKLTSVGDESFNSRLNDFESYTFKNNLQKDIQAFILKPVNFDAKATYPLALLIHGGPQSAHTNQFTNLVLNPSLVAKDKYVVLLINPTGSVGFGKTFSDSVNGDWGGQVYEDLISGVKSMQSISYVDYNHKCVMGISFGGYMTNYIRGKIKEKGEISFNCYGTIDGIFDFRMSAYSVDVPWLMLSSLCPKDKPFCRPYDNDPAIISAFNKFSPEQFVSKWDKAAHLVVHGQNDYRLPWNEGNALFTALQMNGIPSKYLFFYKETHVPTGIPNVIKFDNVVDDFLATYIKKDLTE